MNLISPFRFFLQSGYYNGPDYDWRTSPIDPQAVYASGGKAHHY
jgi:hypothetical protein